MNIYASITTTAAHGFNLCFSLVHVLILKVTGLLIIFLLFTTGLSTLLSLCGKNPVGNVDKFINNRGYSFFRCGLTTRQFFTGSFHN